MYVRKKDKIEKYIDSLVKKHGNCQYVASSQSNYYYINGKCLRVSDHVGANSSGYISIIIPQFKESNNQYIIHGHNSGQISVVDYEKVKEIVRSFFYLSSIFCDITVSRPDVNVNCKEQEDAIKQFNKIVKDVEKIEKARNISNNSILGIPSNYFTQGQIDTINLMVAKVSKTHTELKLHSNE